MRIIHLLVAGMFTLLCAFAPVSHHARTIVHQCVLQSNERDGSSYEKAIIIEETTETTGVAAEYKWLRDHYPNYKMRSQSLSYHDGKPFDVLHIKVKRKKKNVYFDISNFFGKF
ncbi:MAG TPA: hypothetical protein VI112_12135 [Bacteroidia bacterium]|jgi:hypothetical protein